MALDVSQSWLRATTDSAWRRATARARELAGDSVLLVGETVRRGPPPPQPEDSEMGILEAAEHAQLAARSLLLITDGDSDYDQDFISGRLPAGSRLETYAPARGPDLAIAALDLPPAGPAGDTLVAVVRLLAAESGPYPAEVVIHVDDQVVARQSLPPLGPWGSRTERVPFTMPEGPTSARVVAALRAEGDAEPRNDTASRTIRRDQRVSAVALSTAPDFDFRSIAAVLRSTLSLPASVRFRIAGERWVDDQGRAIAEAQVRSEMQRSPLVVLHGDTAYFGPPRAIARGALALVSPPAGAAEWDLAPAPGSPLSFLFATIQFDSLLPVAVGPLPSEAAAVLNAHAGGQRARTAAVVVDGERRTAIVPIRGTARWALRGGAAADGFRTLWGGIFEWLAERPGTAFAAEAPVVAGRELLPQRQVLSTGTLGERARHGERRRPRSHAWIYVLIVAALCGEWILRRRSGLR